MRSGALSVLLLLALAAAAGSAAGAEEIGVITALDGVVSIRHADGTVIGAAKLKDGVSASDVVETGNDARVKILFGDDLLIVIGPNSTAEMKAHIRGPGKRLKSAIIFLKKGALRAILDILYSREATFNVETYNSVAGVMGTDFVVEYAKGTTQTTVSVLQGDVEVRSRFVGGRTRLTANTFAEVAGEKAAPSAPRAMNAAQGERALSLTLPDQLSGRPKSPPERSRLGQGVGNPQAEIVNNPQVEVVGQEPIFVGGPFGSPAKPAAGLKPAPAGPGPNTANRENRIKEFLGGGRR
jgi:hypothetical protein